ncbi:hypothetical protein BD408DRAFT_407453 [Parasitella parasitica]|nr:hypothetical protein BD408DRAFT_407453 [Parasitella parasitica]
MEKVLATRKSLSFEDLVDEASEHEALVIKYDKKKEAGYSHGVQKKMVSFELESNGMGNNSRDHLSEGSSINSVLSDLVNEMRALKISSVEQRELIRQQQHMIAQHNMVIQQDSGNHYQQRGHVQQTRQFINDACYNCGELGHIARGCPYPPRRRQQQTYNNGSGIAGPSQQEIELDVNAVKRTRGGSYSDEGVQDSRRKKGKERADPGPSQQAHPPMFIQQAPTQGDNVVLAKTLQRIREKKPLYSNKVVPPDIMKLLNQPSETGVSILQYLAKDKNASRKLRESLVAIHRARPRNGGTTVVINELKHGESGDDDESSYYDSGSDELSEDDVSSTNDSSYQHSSDGDDDLDTVIDYPFDLKKLMNSQPMRTMVAIGDTLMIATVDTGAAISVMSRRLADLLGLQLIKVNKRFALTGFNDAVSETSVVAKDVSLRIGGKLRREHFCIDNSIRDKDVCLLGRTWFTNHSIKIDSKENLIIIPTREGTKFIEVACVKDGDGEQAVSDYDNVSTVPVYTVSLRKGQQSESQQENGDADEGGQWGQGLMNTYHEDIVSLQDSESGEGKNYATLEEVLDGVPAVVQNVVRNNLNTFYEYGGLGRVNNVSHEIITTSDEPIQSKPYRLTVDEEESLKEELKTLLELDIIRPSSGKYTSPVFFVPKKDGKLRLVVNFQKLNAITVKDGYPLPHIDDILDSLSEDINVTQSWTLHLGSGKYLYIVIQLRRVGLFAKWEFFLSMSWQWGYKAAQAHISGV